MMLSNASVGNSFRVSTAALLSLVDYNTETEIDAESIGVTVETEGATI